MIRLEGFRHVPGKHCGSTALMNAAWYLGEPLSEPTCFGLGAGLGFFLIEGRGMKPSRAISTRSFNLEANFFAHLGVNFAWIQSRRPEEALAQVKEKLREGTPVMLQTDIFYLDYYNSSTHFPGHIVLLTGVDEARGEVTLSDTHFEDVQPLPLSSLLAGWNVEMLPFAIQHNFFPVKLPKRSPGRPLVTADILRRAIRAQAESLLSELDFGPAKWGLAYLEAFAEKLPSWQQSEDAAFCYRFAYQVIEKRGTGGGAFRLIYADFLEEAAQTLPPVASLGLAEMVRSAGHNWSNLSAALRVLSEGYDEGQMKEAQKLIFAIQEQEIAFCRKVLDEL